MTTAEEPIKVQHEYVTDATFVPRATRAFLAYRLIRPGFIVPYAFLAVMAFGIALSLLAGTTYGWISLVILLGFFVFLPLIVAVSVRIGLSRGSPVGSRYAIGLGETAARFEGPLASSEIKYVAFRSVAVRDGFVFLQQRANKQYSLLPIELLPGADLDRLRSAIARANPYSA